jgi:hypothetical protein
MATRPGPTDLDRAEREISGTRPRPIRSTVGDSHGMGVGRADLDQFRLWSLVIRHVQ